MKSFRFEKEAVIEGLIAGSFTGIAIKTGISVDEAGIQMKVLESVCQATNNGAGTLNCNTFIWTLSLLAFAITSYSIFLVIKKVKGRNILGKYFPGIWLGSIIYGLGFLIGILSFLLYFLR